MSGTGVDLFRNEAGGHRIQRVPVTEAQGRVHSSTVTVAVITAAEARVSASYRKREPEDYEISFFSGTGAGGQHRNKHMNSARVTHRPTGIVRTAQTRSRKNSEDLAIAAINEELDRLLETSDAGAVNDARRRQVGSGERGDRRRTWAFQRDEVVDHLTGRRSRPANLLAGKFDQIWG